MLALLIVLSVVLIIDAVRQEKKIDNLKKHEDLTSLNNHIQ